MPTVAAAGIRFHYEECGSGPPLLLIHGTGGSASMFADVAARLASSYRVITYDRRGFARTEAPLPKPDGYLRRHADDAAALLRELGAPDAIVVGWSMGAVIGLALAVHHPDAVARLVLGEPPLHAKKHMGARLAAALGGALALGKLGMPRRGAKRFFRYALAYRRRGFGVRRRNAFDELEPAIREAALANAASVIAELRAGTGEELSPRELTSVRCPIGLVAGDRSARFLGAALDRCAALFPSAEIIRVPGGDHLMNLRQPSALARAIRDLVEDPRVSATSTSGAASLRP